MPINSITKKTTRQRARSAADRLTLKNCNLVMVPVPMPRNHAAEYRAELRKLGIGLTGAELKCRRDPNKEQKIALDKIILRIDEDGQRGIF